MSIVYTNSTIARALRDWGADAAAAAPRPTPPGDLSASRRSSAPRECARDVAGQRGRLLEMRCRISAWSCSSRWGVSLRHGPIITRGTLAAGTPAVPAVSAGVPWRSGHRAKAALKSHRDRRLLAAGHRANAARRHRRSTRRKRPAHRSVQRGADARDGRQLRLRHRHANESLQEQPRHTCGEGRETSWSEHGEP